MIDVTTEIVIERPIEVVAAFAGDPSNAPRWYQNIRSVEWLTPPPLQVGSRLAFVAEFLHRRLEYIYHVADVVEGLKLAMRTDEGPFPMETTYEWTAVDPGRTRMTLRNRGRPTGFSRLFAPFLSTAVTRANRKDLRRLKELMELRRE